jgi:type IV secretion system protein VirB1
MATVESSLNPYAIGVVNGRLIRQPRSLLEGISTVTELRRLNARFSAGVLQIYIGNWAALGLDEVSVFEPCKNMQASARILTDCYARATKTSDDDQVALRRALSCYYSNNFVTGFREGYVQRIVAVAYQLGAAKTIPPETATTL